MMLKCGLTCKCSYCAVLDKPVCTLMQLKNHIIYLTMKVCNFWSFAFCSEQQGNGHRSGLMLEAREREPYMVLMLRSSDAVELMVNGSSCASTSDLLADGMLASRAAASGRLSTPGGSKSKTLARHLGTLIVQAAVDTGLEEWQTVVVGPSRREFLMRWLASRQRCKSRAARVHLTRSQAMGRGRGQQGSKAEKTPQFAYTVLHHCVSLL